MNRNSGRLDASLEVTMPSVMKEAIKEAAMLRAHGVQRADMCSWVRRVVSNALDQELGPDWQTRGVGGDHDEL